MIRTDLGGIWIEFTQHEQLNLKTSQETSQEILRLIAANPFMTIAELSRKIELSDRAIKYNLSTLKKNNKIRRIGPNKGGYWEIVK